MCMQDNIYIYIYIFRECNHVFQFFVLVGKCFVLTMFCTRHLPKKWGERLKEGEKEVGEEENVTYR